MGQSSPTDGKTPITCNGIRRLVGQSMQDSIHDHIICGYAQPNLL